MRTDAELLQLLLDNIDKLRTGLCSLISELYYDNKISLDEFGWLSRLIDKNPTNRTYLGYYFPRGAKEMRIEYLKDLIKKYST